MPAPNDKSAIAKRAVLTTLAFLLCALVASAQGSADLDARLAELTEELEEQRQELHIPGMAIAVVQNDEVIYARGFGSADLEQGKPATPETIFAIGSSTKAFTAAMVGMLVDEGQMGWDDDVTKYLPYFELAIDTEDSEGSEAEVTIRDLLAHRTGFTRMGILWAGGAVSREEALRIAARAEPWSAFRGRFFYNNVTFMAAGLASSVAADLPWDDLLAQRLLSPLGMKSSTSSIRSVEGDERLSRGYLWRDETGQHELLPMRNLDTIAPAGSINSNVVDMAQWLRFQLGRGTFEDRALLSEEQHGETWTKQIEAGPGVDYGLGWMLRHLDGRRIVEHGGNIDGFSAQVALFPDDDLGFVLLTNLSATPLQALSAKIVADALLDEAVEEPEPAAVTTDLSSYSGRYLANFATFKDDFFTVSHEDDRLYVDVPGQMNFQLEPPDAEGKRYFSMTDQIAVVFQQDEGGSVIGLEMHQGGMTFEAPREGVEIAGEIEISKLQRYVGSYRAEGDDLQFEVKIPRQRLAVDVPGEMVYELHPPNDEHKWVFRAIDRIAVSFDEAEDGSVVALRLFRDGEERAQLTRVASTEGELPNVDEILALGRDPESAPWKSLRLSGRVRLVHAGVEGKVIYSSLGQSRFRSENDFGRLGWIHEALNESQGWTTSNVSPDMTLEGKYLTQARVLQGLALPGAWRGLFESIVVTGRETLDDRPVYSLELRNAELPAIDVAIDAETGDLLRAEVAVLEPSLGIAIPTVLRFYDYRDVEGVRTAFRTVSRNDMNGETVVELDKVERDVALEESLFAAPQ